MLNVDDDVSLISMVKTY